MKKTPADELARGRVVVIGAGGLGSPVALSLAAAGVGFIRIVDDDVVELANLQRQTLFREADIGKKKAVVAAERLRLVSGSIEVQAHAARLDAGTAWDLLEDADVVVDGSDNFATRFLVNDTCVLAEIPLVTGGIRQWLGQVLTVWPGRSPCYRCLFEEIPPAGEIPGCAEAGVLGALAGAVGAIQASEALRLLQGLEGRYQGRLFTLEAQSGLMRSVPIDERPDCAVCGDRATIRGLDPARYVAAPCPDMVRR
ncbi:MAG: HesA/MoeB/ThiF family protein [Deltaproteobacteria bacterium]|nr:HesA/MoeB/ThiF family protein [Deltaproteobacteria bacterium]